MSLQDSDKQLVLRVQKGDKRAFDLLVLKHQHKIMSLVSRYVDMGEVPDVAQETFIKRRTEHSKTLEGIVSFIPGCTALL